MIVGFTELAADAWLVDHTRTVDYSFGGEPMIWRSPLWMPFAWEVVAVQFAFADIGPAIARTFRQHGLDYGGLARRDFNIPYYEEMAAAFIGGRTAAAAGSPTRHITSSSVSSALPLYSLCWRECSEPVVF